MRTLFKTTIVIWSEFDPSKIEINDLASEAMDGMAYCSKSNNVLVPDPTKDSDWDGTEFFNDEDDEP